MKKIFFLITALSAFAGAQPADSLLSGNLQADSRYLLSKTGFQQSPALLQQLQNKKSPFLAGLFSIIIPGAGELYNGEYWKAGVFVALEAAVITTAVIYENKGDDKTNEFQRYADDYKNPDHNWSVVRYAQYVINTNLQGIDPGIIISNDESLPPWQRVNWVLLNQYENGTHKLPLHGEQQYYELIGKYPQFTPGWNDFQDGQSILNYPPNFKTYSAMRGKANDYYNVSDKAVIGIYINHFLSTLDAVWSAIQFNKDLAVKIRMERIDFTDYTELVPTLKISFQF
ncbi:MAG TPA: DUF5683 domain-containing protein [Ignavibacteriaceae bacterium]|nr:DUF5683 domain-containing protein [Ignavibacteriaceae bacterium]